MNCSRGTEKNLTDEVYRSPGKKLKQATILEKSTLSTKGKKRKILF